MQCEDLALTNADRFMITLAFVRFTRYPRSAHSLLLKLCVVARLRIGVPTHRSEVLVAAAFLLLGGLVRGVIKAVFFFAAF